MAIKGLRQEMQRLREDVRRIEVRLSALVQRVAKLEGVLDGLREALFGRSREGVAAGG